MSFARHALGIVGGSRGREQRAQAQFAGYVVRSALCAHSHLWRRFPTLRDLFARAQAPPHQHSSQLQTYHHAHISICAHLSRIFVLLFSVCFGFCDGTKSHSKSFAHEPVSRSPPTTPPTYTPSFTLTGHTIAHIQPALLCSTLLCTASPRMRAACAPRMFCSKCASIRACAPPLEAIASSSRCSSWLALRSSRTRWTRAFGS